MISWFVVQSRAGELTPFTVRMSGDPAPLSLPDADLEASLKDLTETLASDAGRIDFTEVILVPACNHRKAAWQTCG